MPDPERAEALRLAWDDIEAVIRGRLGTHEAVVAALDGVVFVKDTLLAAESERAELAREARAVILTYGTPQFADMLCALDSKLAEESSGD